MSPSAPDWRCNDEFQGRPHVGKNLLDKLMENETVRTLWPTEAFSALRSLPRKCQLLFEPSLYFRDFRTKLINIRDTIRQHETDIDVPSNDQIVGQLNEAISDIGDDDGACMELLSSAENGINKQFVTLLRNKHRNPEGAASVGNWLERQLGPGIKQELKKGTVSGGSFLEEFLISVIELGENNGTPDVVEDILDFDLPLDVVARRGVEKLSKQQMHRVLAGFADLINCIKGGGKLHVYEAGAIQEVINLAKTDFRYIIPALTLLEAFTSPSVGEENLRGSEKKDIILTISDHLEYLIKLMKDKELPEAGLLAAQTVVNMLVDRQVWQTARIQHDIVSAFISISSGEVGPRVCLVGLTHLENFSSTRIESSASLFAGYKSIIIQRVLSLLSVGLRDRLLENLAKDTLVALDMEDEVSSPVEVKLRELMERKELYRHSTVVGRVALISLMTKLCKRNEVFITENLISYLLVMIKKTGEEMRSGLVSEDLMTLQRLAVELFCYCVKHKKDKAQSVLTENESERRTLEGMLEKEESGIQDESRLDILEILETIIPGSRQTRITVALLVKMAKSESAECRARVASTLLKFVKENEQNLEMQDKGAFDALMALLEDENEDTRADALLALDLLTRIIPIQTEKLSFKMLSPFLRPGCEEDRKEAVARLLGLVNQNAGSFKVFFGHPDSRKTVLHLLEIDPTNPSSQECAHGILKLATEEDDSVRLELASAGLRPLIKFVTSHGTKKVVTSHGTEEVVTSHGTGEVVTSHGTGEVVTSHGTEEVVTSHGTEEVVTSHGTEEVVTSPGTEEVVTSPGTEEVVTSYRTRLIEENKALLTTVLYLLCKNGNEVDVIKAGGHIFLVSSLGDNNAKEEAARGLSILLNNPATEAAVISAKFVAAAVRSINTNFASSEMALALAKASSSEQGLDEIIKCDLSEGALLSLLERSSIQGKGAAATIISKLYPKLAELNEKDRLEKLSYASSSLFRCLKETEDMSQLREFLKALTVVGSGDKGMNSILQDRGVETLIQHFEKKKSDPEVQRLLLQIFAEISTVLTQATVKTSLSRTMLGDVLIRNKIGKRLCLLSLEENGATNLINLLQIIKNYSYAGQDARRDLGADAAVPVLLAVLKRNIPDVNDHAVKALAKFMEDADGRRRFLASEGITIVADVLKCRELEEVVLSHCIFILAKVVKDAGNQTSRAILNDSVLTLLKDTMAHASNNQVRLQAVDLVHLVVSHGPTSSVCSTINKEGMLNVVLRLLQGVSTGEVLKCLETEDKNCQCKNCIDKIKLKDVISELLKSVRRGDSSCKKKIDAELKKSKLTL